MVETGNTMELPPTRDDDILSAQLSRGHHQTDNYDSSVNQYCVATSSGNTHSGRQLETDPTSVSSTGLQVEPNQAKPQLPDPPLLDTSTSSSLAGNPASFDSRSENSAVFRRRLRSDILVGVGHHLPEENLRSIQMDDADLGLQESSSSSRHVTSFMVSGNDFSSQASFNSGPRTERGSTHSSDDLMVRHVLDPNENRNRLIRRAAATCSSTVVLAGIAVAAYYTLKYVEEPLKASKIASIIGCIVAVMFASLVMVLLKRNLLEAALVDLVIIAFVKFITS